MSSHHDHSDHNHSHEGHACAVNIKAETPRYRRVLWIALIINLAMFIIEISASWNARSSSLLADSVDFAGDAANYAVSLWALGAAAIWRSKTALWKGYTMLLFTALVAGKVIWQISSGHIPQASTMGLVGALALAANVGVAILLYAFREGDANMRSVWLCTRNDAIGNFLVLVAALGVFGTATVWPDVAVALVMAGLALRAGLQVIAQAKSEIAAQASTVPHAH